MLPAARLPAARTHRYAVTDVLSSALAAVSGSPGTLRLPPVRHAVVILMDGLGYGAVQEYPAYLRRIAIAATVEPIQTVFPSTTASALASLTTGQLPGVHGLVGYLGFDAAADRVVNSLTDWGQLIDPASWQRVPTLFEAASAAGIPSFAVGPGRYRASGFTSAVLRGAEYRAAGSLADRLSATRDIHASTLRSLSYVYAPELDVAAHATGVGSDAWLAALEDMDFAVGSYATGLGPDTGVLLTGDHGVIDVRADDQIIVPPDLLDGVRHVSGEPRCLALHLAPDADPDAVAANWRASQGGRIWAFTRHDAITAGLFGDVDPDVLARIGDVLIAARTPVAYYLDPDDRGRAMVGQHGSLTTTEREIPLLRLGAFRGRP